MYVLLVPPFLVFLNWRLAILALVTTPVTVGVSTLAGRATRRFMKRNAEANGAISAMQVQSLSDIRALKSMAAEPFVFAQAAAHAETALRLQLQTGGLGALVGAINAAVRAGGAGVFAWYAWGLILSGEMSLGSFVAFSAYMAYLTGPVGQLADLFADFQQSAVTLGRAFEYLDTVTEQPAEAAYVLPGPLSRVIRGFITFDSVSFGYVPGKRVLGDISIEFTPGSVTAVVGISGAGKSTILRLICGMERAWAGKVSVDGIPIDSFSLSDLRRQVAVVWQESTMFRGTIWENLTLGRPDLSQEDVDSVVTACGLAALVQELPDGYQTMIAEWGASVSGGQRQRFAIARALLRGTPVLLLDETTSQIDVHTEEALLRDTLPLFRDKTVILVTHRVSTAALADRICVVGDGRIVGSGSHEELASSNAEYGQLCAASQRHEARLRPLYAR
jgi:ABC-type bacteriocin/lantibiotic exporter with double-glycine peptidase domain